MSRQGKKSGKPLDYWCRSYRDMIQPGLVATQVRLMESDLQIFAPEPVDSEALTLLSAVRSRIETYIASHPDFLRSLVPLAPDPVAPAVVRRMLAAGRQAGVGPMAAVAGVVAEAVGQGLLRRGHGEVIVENGGDLYLARSVPCTVAVYAGRSPLSGRVGIRLAPEQMPCGVCTSSASIGHSLSLGKSDAAMVVAPDAGLADALATRLGNEIREGGRGMDRALELARKTNGVTGAVVIAADRLGVWGNLELVRVEMDPGGDG